LRYASVIEAAETNPMGETAGEALRIKLHTGNLMRPNPRCLMILLTSSALLLAGCGPVSSAFHDPHALPVLEQDSRVHYQPGAETYAREVARILPTALARIEAAHGRPFGKPFIVVAFLDNEAYAVANGRGDANPRGVTFFDRVTLSPRLWRDDRAWLEGDLTHELSHEHLFSHLSMIEYYRIPVWFTEGIAVMASDGGGAQRISAQEAHRAIEVPDDPNLFGNVSLKAPAPAIEGEDMRLRMHTAYRQAALFVAHLRDGNAAAFNELLDRIYTGEKFKAAFEASYKSTVAQAWQRFVERCPRG
jgi:hypothetical protein